MTVYVDDAIHSWRGRLWAHLFSDDLDELHAFARRLGLQPSWFQKPPAASWPHYDVTAAKRREAVRLGAVPADRPTTLEVAWRLQGELSEARLARIAAARETAARKSAPAQMGLPGL